MASGRRRRSLLPGDVIADALRTGDPPPSLPAGQPPDRERGSLDPQTVAEFLAYDLPFDVEPATGFGFPMEVDRG